jgi:uncharacterized SAM-binding protein YcdF (DUF218 family)
LVARGRAFLFRFLIPLAVLALLLAVSYALWLPLVGRALVHDDGPSKADLAVVLGGDYWGHRIDTAAMLVRRGYVPSVLVSGPPGFYGFHESDLAIPYAAGKGFPAEWFQAFPHEALSTREEASVLLAELRRRGVQRVLIVTSDFHSARARRIFLAAEKAMGGGPEIRMVAAPDEFFHADSWWRGRESQKTTFFEWSKTVATALGY